MNGLNGVEKHTTKKCVFCTERKMPKKIIDKKTKPCVCAIYGRLKVLCSNFAWEMLPAGRFGRKQNEKHMLLCCESKEDDAGENDSLRCRWLWLWGDYDYNDNIKINSCFSSHWLGFACWMLGTKVKEYMYSLKSSFNGDLPCYMVKKNHLQQIRI